MKVGIFSDIHGNLGALNEMFKECYDRGVTTFLFAGDIFGYFYEQQEIISLLMKMDNLSCVIGNHDAKYLECLKNEELMNEMIEKYGVSYRTQLTVEEIEWFKRLPRKLSFGIDNKRICMVHGSLQDELNGRIYPDSIIPLLDILDYDLVIMGHTHYQMLVKEHNTLILNPGSLGQPRDKKGFSYAIFDTDSNEVEIHKVSLDTRQLYEQIKRKEISITNKQYLIRKMEMS